MELKSYMVRDRPWLSLSYAMSGTELWYGPTRRHTTLLSASSRVASPHAFARRCPAVSGTGIGHVLLRPANSLGDARAYAAVCASATTCSVLTSRMLLPGRSKAGSLPLLA
eukprot:3941595-Rhodomonas_salina.1